MWPFLKKHVTWFLTRIDRDRVDSASAHGAFFLIISFLPFLAFLLTLMQMIHFSSGLTMIEAALELLPPAISTALSALIPSPLVASGVLPVAVVTAVWSSSMGMVAIIKGLDHVYEVKESRNYILLRAIAVLYVVLLAVALIAAALLLVFGSTIYRFLSARWPTLAALLINFKSLAGFVLLFVFFALLYSFVPRRRIKLRYNLAGAAFGAGGWVLFSFFFSLFVENFSNFSLYGSLATLVILMFWLFFCMYILFLGGEVSMWLATSGVQKDFRALLRGKPKKYKFTRTPAHTEATADKEGK
ncbi:YihY/virulence factor BrkB family protein [Acutalibacter caecimuris]|uniref:YihY/virulence factor BrkB family protein n=1 Tax=Acutalibacter caecimuris TaxID=3093657 RepID=UPI002AC8DEB7|nr:YihY/virulence factor BrkB family protein [Acutalibacter sp. M00118]